MFDAGIIIIERPRIAPLFGSQGYRKVAETPNATFAGFVERGRDIDLGDVYAVVGCGHDDGKYFVNVDRGEDVVKAFVSEARKILNTLPDRGRAGTYQREELKLARKKKPLDPSSPLYRALVVGVKAAHPSSNPQII